MYGVHRLRHRWRVFVLNIPGSLGRLPGLAAFPEHLVFPPQTPAPGQRLELVPRYRTFLLSVL
jgi:hypothetical protein